MKAMCIIGSPKENGSTAFLVDTIIEGMKSQNIGVSRYVLHKMNINYCRGCEKCEIDQACVQKDDMAVLIDEISRSDSVFQLMNHSLSKHGHTISIGWSD
jgi:multimeric flavodoxin WrbA